MRGRPSVAYALAALYGLPSLAWPFGGDTAAFRYVARGWLAGSVPYHGAVDNKPPGIFVVHALAVLVFGESQVGIRLLELVATLACGWLVGRALRLPPFFGGLAALALAGVTFTAFGYWETGQVEIWEALFLCAAWAARRRCFLSGALVGVAFVFKFPAAIVGVGIALACAREHGATVRRFLPALLVFVAGAALAVTVVMLPFVLAGASVDAWDALVSVNRVYVRLRFGSPQASFGAFWLDHAGIYFVSAVLLAGARLVVDRRARRQRIEVLLLLLAAILSVLVQQKLYAYHWAVVAPFLVAAATWGVSRFSRAPAFACVAAVVTAGFVLMPAGPHGWCATPYRSHVANLARYAEGASTRHEYLSAFDMYYPYASAEELGLEARRLSNDPSADTLCVFFQDPAGSAPVYTVSGFRCPSRFFLDHILGYVAYRNKELVPPRVRAWSDEHADALHRTPPTFVVTWAAAHDRLEELTGQRYEPVLVNLPQALFRRLP